MADVGLLPALGLCVGVALGLALPWPAGAWLGPLCGAATLAVASWAGGRGRTATVALVAGFLSCGAAAAARARDDALNTPLRRVLDAEVGGFALDAVGPGAPHDPFRARALILEDAAVRDGFVSLRLEVRELYLRGRWRPAAGVVIVSIGGAAAPDRAGLWVAGRVVEAPIAFRRPARYLDDGVADNERDLALAGTTLLGSVKSGLLVEVRGRGSPLHEAAGRSRRRVRQAVERWIGPHDETASAITAAVLIGDRAAIPDAVRDRLQAAGTYHVIAISGGNIAIFAALSSALCALCGLRPRQAAFVTAGAVAAYGVVVVAGPSVRRAVIVALVYLLARLFDHRAAAWHAAAVAAALMLVVRPLDLRDPGFLLTFGAAGALLLLSRRLDVGHLQPRAYRWLVEAVLASAAVEAALFGVQAVAFSRVTVAGIGLNLLAVPLMAVVQVAGMAVVGLDLCHLPANVAAVVASRAAEGIVASASWVALVPGLAPRVPPPTPPMTMVYYAGLALAVWGARRVRAAGILLSAGVAVWVIAGGRVAWPVDWPRPDSVRLVAFDVGQGDSLLLQAGRNAAVLVDTGGSPFGSGFDVGSRVLLPALWATGVRRLSALVITHGDPDHLGGAPGLIESLAVGQAWLGVRVPSHAPSEAVLAELAQRRIATTFVRSGSNVSVAGLRLRVLNPPEPEWERRRVRNDDSVVIEAVAGDVAMLLTGDIGAEIERAILPQLTPAAIRILKVAHHGSRTSSSAAFVESWRPQLAIVSAGRGNPFGHPAADVVDRLRQAGAVVLRTDRDGEITVDSDGRRVTWRTFTGRRGRL